MCPLATARQVVLQWGSCCGCLLLHLLLLPPRLRWQRLVVVTASNEVYHAIIRLAGVHIDHLNAEPCLRKRMKHGKEGRVQMSQWITWASCQAGSPQQQQSRYVRSTVSGDCFASPLAG